jgi:uncharacterized membrane-anchored protein
MKNILNNTLSKVPEVTLGFWILKIIATILGEVGGNAVSQTLEMGYLMGSIIFGIPLIIAVIEYSNKDRHLLRL